MVELTCPWDSYIERSHTFKEEKFSTLVADLSSRFRVKYYPIEISVRGQVSKGNKSRIKSFMYDSCVSPIKIGCRISLKNRVALLI